MFYKKSIRLGDYISFILPISQLNNPIQYYDFDLVYSEDLGKRLYSNIEVHCCLNIFRKPVNGMLNKKPDYTLKDVIIKEAMRNNYNPKARRQIIKYKDFNYNIRICGFGASIGKEVAYEEQFVKELCIKINNEKYRNKVIELIRNAQWKEIYRMTKTPNLTHWQIYKYIKEQIPEIE